MEIKFYSFTDFGVSAIIMAKDRKSAIEGYRVHIEDMENQLVPREITYDEAMTYFIKTGNNEPLYKVLGDFYDSIKSFTDKLQEGKSNYEILLLDSWLC